MVEPHVILYFAAEKQTSAGKKVLKNIIDINKSP